MSPLLIALLAVLLVPLFVATWRTSLFGLACQGFLMAWIASRLAPMPFSPSDWVTLAELTLVRGVGAPLALYLVMRARGGPARNDVIPPNLLSWTLAFAIVLVAFNFSERLVEAGDQRTLVAVAATGVMFGFLVLASQADPLSQMIGALRIENAIALFELGGARHEPQLAVQLGQVAVVVLTIVLSRSYLVTSGNTSTGSPSTTASKEEAPTL
jgi:hydrogenase-4 membrane subunit HyfE